jgi:hypothetical protein
VCIYFFLLFFFFSFFLCWMRQRLYYFYYFYNIILIITSTQLLTLTTMNEIRKRDEIKIWIWIYFIIFNSTIKKEVTAIKSNKQTKNNSSHLLLFAVNQAVKLVIVFVFITIINMLKYYIFKLNTWNNNLLLIINNNNFNYNQS